MTERRVRPRGFEIRYRSVGRGSAVLLLHGFGSDGDMWFEQGYVDALAEHCLVLVPDLLGHGASDKPHDPAAYSHEGRALDLAAVLDDAGVDLAHVWGYSMGGRNAYGFAVHQPGRTASLIVGGAGPEIKGDDWEPRWMDARADALDAGDWPRFWQLMGGPPGDHFRSTFERNDPKALAAASRGLRSWPVTSARELRVPSLHYVGSNDPFAPRVVEAARASGGRLVVLDGADHLSATTRVEELVDTALEHIGGA